MQYLLSRAHSFSCPLFCVQHNLDSVSLRNISGCKHSWICCSVKSRKAEELSAEWKERRPLLSGFLVHQMYGCHQDKWAAVKSAELGKQNKIARSSSSTTKIRCSRHSVAKQRASLNGKERMVLFDTMWNYDPVLMAVDITFTEKGSRRFLSVMLLATSVLRTQTPVRTLPALCSWLDCTC